MTVSLVSLITFGRFVNFNFSGKSKTGKTLLWKVFSTDSNDLLGEIRWYAPWRQYCYFQEPQIIMSHECLTEIADFLRRQKQERKERN